MNPVMKSVTAVLSPGDDPGSFDAIISTGSLDRDGEVVSPNSWAIPLPAQISLNVNHSSSVEDVVASGQPWLDEVGNLRVKGRFARTDQAQKVRSLVADGHLRSLSVEFLRHRSANGQPLNELVGAAFVLVPANPEAVVLSAKSFSEQLDLVLKAAGDGDAAMVQAIHDAAGHLGAACVVPLVTDQDPSGVDDRANKAVALSLRLKALSR